MKIAILGAGAIGFASAAMLSSYGHTPVLWSPSGQRTAKLAQGMTLKASGALTGEWQVATAATMAHAVDGADVVLLAIDANGHRTVMEAAAAHLRDGQVFAIGAAHAMTGLYLSRALRARGVKLPIVSWNTSLGTAHQDDFENVTIRSVRPAIEASVIGDADFGLGICREAFGDRFRQRSNALEIALLANSNPVFHVPVALLNLTRIEQREVWATYHQTTPAVGNLIEAIDAERIAIGAAYGATIHSVNEHFHRSFKVPQASMTEMNQALHAAGRGPKGATSTAHRHLRQDIPYGLVFASEIAKIASVASPIHDATIALASASLGHDFGGEAPLAGLFGGRPVSKSDLLALATEGF
jgi:opine dehydrogenase